MKPEQVPDSKHKIVMTYPNLDPKLDNLTFDKRFTSNRLLALSKTKGFVAILITLVIAIIIASFFFVSFTNSKNSKDTTVANPVLTVTVEKARTQEIEDEAVITGSISAWDELSIGAEVSGLALKTINVEEGDTVKKGQILATLNSGILQAQLEQAQARLSSSQASLRKAIQPNRPEDILMLKAAVSQTERNVQEEEAHKKQALVNLENTLLNANRYNELSRMGAVSAQDAENKQVAADIARHQLASSEEKVQSTKYIASQAKQRLLMAERGGRNEDIQISRSTLAEMQAQIKNLEEQIAQTIIRAPDNGTIAKRNAHIGDISTSGKVLFTIIRQNKLEMRAQVPELDLTKFVPGQEVIISSKEEEDKNKIRGTVRLISPQVDPVTRLGTVRIDLPKNSGYKPGMFVHAKTSVSKRKTITIPIEALVVRNGESSVFTVSSLKDKINVQNNSVLAGVQNNRFVEIVKGIEADSLVVCKGARFLNDGDLVQIVPNHLDR